MKKILIALSVLATTQIAMAGSTTITKIKNVYVYEHYAVIKMANKHANPNACKHPNANEFLLMPTYTSGGSKMYSALLSAYVSGQKVKLGYSRCSVWGSTTIPRVYGITLVK